MLLKRIIPVFLTLLILFADSGQMIYAHTCYKSNQTSISLFSADTCCGKEKVKKNCCTKQAEEKKSCSLGKMSCCSVSSTYLKQSFPTNEVKASVTAPVGEIFIELNLFSTYIIDSAPKVFLQSPPPSLRSKDDISFARVFRI
jgi:hypothetical protein